MSVKATVLWCDPQPELQPSILIDLINLNGPKLLGAKLLEAKLLEANRLLGWQW